MSDPIAGPAVEQLLYSLLCAVAIGAIFHLQRYRHATACAPLWWSYTALAFGLGWEIIDTWKFGAPGFPASRWIVVPALAFIMSWAAIADSRQRRAA